MSNFEFFLAQFSKIASVSSGALRRLAETEAAASSATAALSEETVDDLLLPEAAAASKAGFLTAAVEESCRRMLSLSHSQTSSALRAARFYETMWPHLIELKPSSPRPPIEDVFLDLAGDFSESTAATSPLRSKVATMSVRQTATDTLTDVCSAHSGDANKLLCANDLALVRTVLDATRCPLAHWQCTALLTAIGWDVLLDLWMLATKDIRFVNVLLVLFFDYDSPRELFVMLPECLSNDALRKCAFLTESMGTCPTALKPKTQAGDSSTATGSLSELASSRGGGRCGGGRLAEQCNAIEDEMTLQITLIRCIALLFHKITDNCKKRRATSGSQPPPKVKHYLMTAIPHLTLFFEHISKKYSYQWYLFAQQTSATSSSPMPSTVSRSAAAGPSTAMSAEREFMQNLMDLKRFETKLTTALTGYLHCSAHLCALFDYLTDFSSANVLPIVYSAFDLHKVALKDVICRLYDTSLGKEEDEDKEADEIATALASLKDDSVRNRLEEVLWTCKLGWSLNAALYWWYSVSVKVPTELRSSSGPLAHIHGNCMRAIDMDSASLSSFTTPSEFSKSPELSTTGSDLEEATAKSTERMDDSSLTEPKMGGEDTAKKSGSKPKSEESLVSLDSECIGEPIELAQCRRLSDGLTSTQKAKREAERKRISKRELADATTDDDADENCDIFSEYLSPFILEVILPCFKRLNVGNPPLDFMALERKLLAIERELEQMDIVSASSHLLEFAASAEESIEEKTEEVTDISGAIAESLNGSVPPGMALDIIDEDAEMLPGENEDDDAVSDGWDDEDEDDDEWPDDEDMGDWGDDDHGLDDASVDFGSAEDGGGVGGKRHSVTKTAEQLRFEALSTELRNWQQFLTLSDLATHLHACVTMNALFSTDSTAATPTPKLLSGASTAKPFPSLFGVMEVCWAMTKQLIRQTATTVCGIELGEYLLGYIVSRNCRRHAMPGKLLPSKPKSDGSSTAVTLLNSSDFHRLGLWKLSQELIESMDTTAVKSPAPVQCRLWALVLKVIAVCDLPTRFQCITSIALQSEVPHVCSLMFTELKNQVLANWRRDEGDDSEAAMRSMAGDLDVSALSEAQLRQMMAPPMNPFVSRSLPMIFVQQIARVLETTNTQSHAHSHSCCGHSHSHSGDVDTECGSVSGEGKDAGDVKADYSVDEKGDTGESAKGECRSCVHTEESAASEGLSLETLERHLDPLTSCLNVARFVLLRDARTNWTQIYDSDCPLRPALTELRSQLSALVSSEPSTTGAFEDTRAIFVKNQTILAIDLIEMCLSLLTKER